MCICLQLLTMFKYEGKCFTDVFCNLLTLHSAWLLQYLELHIRTQDQQPVYSQCHRMLCVLYKAYMLKKKGRLFFTSKNTWDLWSPWTFWLHCICETNAELFDITTQDMVKLRRQDEFKGVISWMIENSLLDWNQKVGQTEPPDAGSLWQMFGA